MDNEPLSSPYAAQPSKLESPVRAPASLDESALGQISGMNPEITAKVNANLDEALGKISGAADKVMQSAGAVPNPSPNNPVALGASAMPQPDGEMSFLQRGQVSYGTGISQKFDIVKDMVGPENVRLAKVGDEDVIEFRMPGEGDDKFHPIDSPRFTLNDVADMFGGALQAATTGGVEAAAGYAGGPAGALMALPAAGALGVGVNRMLYELMYGKKLPGNGYDEAKEAAMYNTIFGVLGRGAQWLGERGQIIAKDWRESRPENVAKAFVKLKKEFHDMLASMAGPESKAIPDSIKVGRELVGNTADGTVPTTAAAAEATGKKMPAMYRIKQKLGDEIGVYTTMVDSNLRSSGRGLSVDPYLNHMLEVGGKPGFFAGGPPEWKPFFKDAKGRIIYNKLPVNQQALEDVALNKRLGTMNSKQEYEKFANIYNGLVTLRQGSKEEILRALENGSMERSIDGFILEPTMSMAEREAGIKKRKELMDLLKYEAKYRMPSVNGDGNYGVSASTLQNYLDTAAGLSEFDKDSSKMSQDMYKMIYGRWANQKHKDFGQFLGAQDKSGYMTAVRKFQENIGTVRNFIQTAQASGSADSVLRSFFTPNNYDSAEKIKALVMEESPKLWRDIRGAWLGDAFAQSITPEGLVSGSKLVTHLESMGKVKDLIFDNQAQYKQFVAQARRLEVLSKKIAADSPELRSSLSDLFIGMIPSSAGVAGITSSTSRIRVVSDLLKAGNKTTFEHVEEALLDAAKKASDPDQKRNAMFMKNFVANLKIGAKVGKAASGAGKLIVSPAGRQAALLYALSQMKEKPVGALTEADLSAPDTQAFLDAGFTQEEIKDALKSTQ